MIACLYDVHGNLPALEAVLDDARGQGAERYLLGGDYALFGGWPAESVARLRELGDATWIRGNGERWTANPAEAPEHVQGAVAASREALGPETVAELGDLREQVEIGQTLVVHGSPKSDVESFAPEAADDDGELLGDARPGRLLFGHTHVPFCRRLGEIELVNPGSVGMPFDGDPRASYALVHADGRVEHRRVAYDHEASARRVRDLTGGSAWGERVAQRIIRARFDA